MDAFIGEIRLFPFHKLPTGWLECDGRSLPTEKHKALYAVIGQTFGGNGADFNLPDIRGRFPLGEGGDGGRIGRHAGDETVTLTETSLPTHNHMVQTASAASTNSPTNAVPAAVTVGDNIYSSRPPNVDLASDLIEAAGAAAVPHNHVPPGLGLTFAIRAEGPDARADAKIGVGLGEIRIFAYHVDNSSWQPCDGRELPIADNQALYSIMGSAFGGDERTSFHVPDLRGRIPFHPRDGQGVGHTGGEATHVLRRDELPAHTHVLRGRTEQPPNVSGKTSGGVLSTSKKGNSNPTSPPAYGTIATGRMHTGTVTEVHGDAPPHNNMPPVLTVGFHLAVRGIFPVRD